MKKMFFVLLITFICLGLAASSVVAENLPANDRDPLGPFNLTAFLVDDDNVLLCWENPEYENLPMGYRIYCNNNMVRILHGADIMDCMLENVCEGCHQFYVTAWFDSGGESIPSNTVEMTVTANSDPVANDNGMQLKAYPNPIVAWVRISFSHYNGKADVPVSIYDAKGRLVRTVQFNRDGSVVWDGTDLTGHRAAAGIYFIKAVTDTGNFTQKVYLLK
jgi:hypothetical protein